MSGSAIISPCGQYRYQLERHAIEGGGSGCVTWIMVNPSTADASEDDATIRKVTGFSRRLGFGWFMVGNVFAYRSTDVRGLARVADPIGPENEAWLRRMMAAAPTVVVAWGPVAKLPKELRKRYQRVVRIANEIGVTLHCLGTAQDGHPRHPLMLSYDTPLTPWSPPRD